MVLSERTWKCLMRKDESVRGHAAVFLFEITIEMTFLSKTQFPQQSRP